MKKKFLLIIFAIFISITCLGKVDAAKELSCKYCDGHKTYKLKFEINGDISTLKSAEMTNVAGTSDIMDLITEMFNLHETDSCPEKIYIKSSVKNGWQFFKSQPEENFSEINMCVEPGENTPVESPQQTTDLGYSSCINYRSKETCNKSISTGKVGCVWKNLGKDSDDNDFGFCSTTGLTYVACGDAIDIPSEVPRIASLAVTLLKIGTAIVLILMGTITLLKAVYSSKEDEIKKAQSSFIKKLIAAALVFFIVSIVQFIILKVADTGTNGEDAGIKECLSCFLNDDCDSVTYYKNVDFADNETCYKVPTTANATPTEITCPALPNN